MQCNYSSYLWVIWLKAYQRTAQFGAFLKLGGPAVPADMIENLLDKL